jgi:hypothetical protein
MISDQWSYKEVATASRVIPDQQNGHIILLRLSLPKLDRSHKDSLNDPTRFRCRGDNEKVNDYP